MSLHSGWKITRWILELLVLIVVLYQICRITDAKIDRSLQLGNATARECGPGSEFDAINSGMSYHLNGFSSNAGLPDRAAPHGGLWLNPDDRPAAKKIYTHYPPGPNWLVGLSIRAFGPAQVPLYRLVPIFFSVFCWLLTFIILRRSLGPILSGAAIVTILAIPMTTGMMHSLFLAYPLALLLTQISYAFALLKVNQPLKTLDYTFLFGASFVQGWFGFDFAFLTTLFPLALAPAWRSASSRLVMIKIILISGFAFTMAHVMHFGQLWVYYNSFGQAFADLANSAKHRFDQIQGPRNISSRAAVVEWYAFQLYPGATQGGWWAWRIPAVTVVLVFFISLFRQARPAGHDSRKGSISAFIAMFCGLLISLLWIWVMRNHAAELGHYLFLPRHFILLLTCCVLVIAEQILDISERIKRHAGPGIQHR